MPRPADVSVLRIRDTSDVRARLRLATLLALAVSATLLAVQPAQSPATLGAAERIADGVELYRLNEPNLLNPPGPVAVQALRLDPGKVRIDIGLAQDRLPARETVQGIAGRNGALAAVNAGFFALADGGPAGFLKKRGTVVGRSRRPRGAVAFTERSGKTRLLFDRVSVVLPPKGKVEYQPRLGTSPKDWARAANAVGGAGLLMLDGRALTEWAEEQLSTGFDTTRHPRTMIGVDAQDAIWLVTVDGRQPALSLGMSFTELQGLSRRLGLKSSLNLDGGGSTTMVVRGSVVNHPSDAVGPRQVSDAILVLARKR
jgi:exopolysaccharide biosynthesis protein